ncbi:RCC1/BLIP-II [Phanerochaete sordida]|uniref:RCC1/BLIP-II n=1 Tax=Phanerochaete sordida TaxID=48140 RepID=A0A9P3G061_9APHY|nr:RCC1/BLIP-II [Phanerochaete sordida]
MFLVAAGSNAQGQLATGDQEDAHTFTHCRFAGHAPGQLPPGTQKVCNLACGANHTLLLLERKHDAASGTRTELWGCGDGSKHQLGPAVAEFAPVFVPLDLELQNLGLEDYTIASVAACWETSFVVLTHPTQNAVVLSRGSDDYGDLGIGGTQGTDARRIHRVAFSADCLGTTDPVRVRSVSLATGPHHAIALLAVAQADGVHTRVAGWGAARHGQLGALADARTGRPLPAVAAPHPVALPDAHTPPRAIALGNQHSVFLCGGRAIGIGAGRRGQLRGLEEVRDVAAVGCTWNGTYVVSRGSGTCAVLSLGAAHKGQLGRRVPADTADAALAGGPAPGRVEFPFAADTRELIKLACGSEHVLCLFSVRDVPDDSATSLQHEVWAWGWNEHGTLGDGTTEDRGLPVKVWPPDEHARRAVDIFAGCGNSWIVLES